MKQNPKSMTGNLSKKLLNVLMQGSGKEIADEFGIDKGFLYQS